MYSRAIVVAASFAVGVSAHGHVISPTPRAAGSAFKAACGQQVSNVDTNGNIQNMAQVGAGQSDFTSDCFLAQCRGYKFADDSAAEIHSFSPGQTVDFSVQIAAPHTGVCNVSVIDLAANSIIGEPLISFTNYASNQNGVAANNTAFSVTIPTDLDSKCGTAGNCALQWWWDAHDIDQTYLNCVDFALGSGSGSTGSSSATVTATAAGTTAASTTLSTSSVSASAATAAKPAATSSAAADASAGGETSCEKRRVKRSPKMRLA